MEKKARMRSNADQKRMSNEIVCLRSLLKDSYPEALDALSNEELAGLAPLIHPRRYSPEIFDKCFKEYLMMMTSAYRRDEKRVKLAYKEYSSLFFELSSAIKSIERTLNQLEELMDLRLGKYAVAYENLSVRVYGVLLSFLIRCLGLTAQRSGVHGSVEDVHKAIAMLKEHRGVRNLLDSIDTFLLNVFADGFYYTWRGLITLIGKDPITGKVRKKRVGEDYIEDKLMKLLACSVSMILSLAVFYLTRVRAKPSTS